MKNLFLLLAVGLFLSLTPARTQDLTPVDEAGDALRAPDEFRTSIYFQGTIPAGFMWDFGQNNIRRELRSIDARLSRFSMYANFGGGLRVGRFYYEMDFNNSYMPFQPSGNRISTDYQFYSVGLNLGYAVYQDQNNVVILRGGVAGTVHTIQIHQRGGVMSFNDLGNTASLPRAWPMLGHGGFALDVSVELPGQRQKRFWGMSLGTRIGYIHGIGRTNWEALGVASDMLPDRTRRLYFSSIFRFSSNFKKRKPK